MEVKSSYGVSINVMGEMSISLSGYKKTECYKVLSSDGEDSLYRLYYMDGEIWLGHWGWYGEKKDAFWCEYIIKINSGNIKIKSREKETFPCFCYAW